MDRFRLLINILVVISSISAEAQAQTPEPEATRAKLDVSAASEHQAKKRCVWRLKSRKHQPSVTSAKIQNTQAANKVNTQRPKRSMKIEKYANTATVNDFLKHKGDKIYGVDFTHHSLNK